MKSEGKKKFKERHEQTHLALFTGESKPQIDIGVYYETAPDSQTRESKMSNYESLMKDYQKSIM